MMAMDGGQESGGTMQARRGSAAEVFGAFLRLGLTSFGGPVAHIGYFHTDLVTRRGWIDEAGFADLVALCQFLPGPASSQLGMALGLRRAGALGMLAAWVGFTLPSALVMAGFALGLHAWGVTAQAPWLHGLKLVAVAVVAQAVWAMANSLAPDRPRGTLAAAACVLVLALPGVGGQVAALALGALAGWLVLPRASASPGTGTMPMRVARVAPLVPLGLFFMLLLALPVLAPLGPVFRLIDAFYRAGALVFGGGHVVLPLLQDAVVRTGMVGQGAFLAGYGAAQAMPGPLFTFASFLGAAMNQPPTGWLGAALATVAIFLPSFLLVAGVLPFWDGLRRRATVQAMLRGVNAAVVGLLIATLFTPVWTEAVATRIDFAMVVVAFAALVAWRVPPWAVVVGGALVEQLL
jgi:chromate transporter